MSVVLSPGRPEDTPAYVTLRGLTRENAISAERLAALGITADGWAASMREGRLVGTAAHDAGTLMGYAFGDTHTGEVVVLALLPQAEGRGLGRALLAEVLRSLREAGHARAHLWASDDPGVRSHGFYRHLGWRPTGRRDGHGDEELELRI